METDFQLGKMKSFRDGRWCGDGECEYTSCHRTIHLKIAKMVNIMVIYFITI